MNKVNCRSQKVIRFAGILLLVISLLFNFFAIIRTDARTEAQVSETIHEPAFSEKDSAENNMDMLLQLQKHRFMKLDRSQLIELAEYLVRMAGYELGVSEPIRVQIGKLEENQCAYYSMDSNTVILSEDLVTSNDPYLFAEAVNHEVFHSAEWEYVCIYRDKISEEEKKLYFIRNSMAPIYDYEFRNYQKGSKEEGYLNYFLQLIELDAMEWAEDTTDRYYRMIDSYMKEHSIFRNRTWEVKLIK